MCWALEVPPSALRRIYWTLSFNDLRVKLKLRSSFEQVKFTQGFQVLAEIVSAAFGKEKSSDTNVMVPKNMAEAESMLRVVLGR